MIIACIGNFYICSLFCTCLYICYNKCCNTFLSLSAYFTVWIYRYKWTRNKSSYSILIHFIRDFPFVCVTCCCIIFNQVKSIEWNFHLIRCGTDIKFQAWRNKLHRSACYKHRAEFVRIRCVCCTRFIVRRIFTRISVTQLTVCIFTEAPYKSVFKYNVWCCTTCCNRNCRQTSVINSYFYRRYFVIRCCYITDTQTSKVCTTPAHHSSVCRYRKVVQCTDWNINCVVISTVKYIYIVRSVV